MSYQPLAGVRVLDLTRLLPGAIAARKLAYLGAEVVKIEEPDRGDYLRTIPPMYDNDESFMHKLLNRGKRSVALDLKTESGRSTFNDLAGHADAILEVSRPGRFREIGIDFARLREAHPQLVVCSITGFGQTGPLASLASHGMNMDCLAGSAPFERDGEDGWSLGRSVFASIAVELGGVNAALATTAAILHARSTGEGTWIDASCWDAAVEANRLAIAHKLATGTDVVAVADLGPLYAVYQCRDGGLVLLCAIEHKFWKRFCEGVSRPHLTERWRGDGEVDFGLDAALSAELRAIFAEEDAEVWQTRFHDWDIPGSRLLSIDEVLEHPHLEARQMVAGDEGFPSVLDPIRWADGTRPGADARPARPLGADTSEVLAEWLGVG